MTVSIPTPRPAKVKKPPRHYVNNKVLTQAIVEYQTACKEAIKEGKQTPPVPRNIGEMFYAIAKNRATAPDFSGYSYKEDMISDATMVCILRVHSFNAEKSSNAFAYYTTVIFNAFIHFIKLEKREVTTKTTLTEKAFIFGENVHTQDGMDGSQSSDDNY